MEDLIDEPADFRRPERAGGPSDRRRKSACRPGGASLTALSQTGEAAEIVAADAGSGEEQDQASSAQAATFASTFEERVTLRELRLNHRSRTISRGLLSSRNPSKVACRSRP